ncbi:phosphoenolpyruvate-protein phosphotransferase [Candidatus Uabimicrobium amorphum]|uniref:Phosphoenolpyruvate-protein phosphotransferase n=2 Tax=Uabimicrobium amorphum TaxID=2596890 RepID=A0A5S9IJU6_UABAM|nr:phosphoenolpyruvate-protein phosphotransferase [Candidatus Uabimicrobium amorphum]
MEVRGGIAVTPAITVGKAFILDREQPRVTQQFIRQDKKTVESEKTRYLKAQSKAIKELKKIEKQTADTKDISIIFCGHRLILEESQQEILYTIENNFFKAEYAVHHLMQSYQQNLSSRRGELYSRRISDLKDIENRLLKHLTSHKNISYKSLRKPVVIVAKELTPSQTALLPLNKIVGIITNSGGQTSHTAIVARTRGINAIVGIGEETNNIFTGDTVILDGFTGKVVIRPTKKTIDKYKKQQQQQKIKTTSLQKIKQLRSETKDQHSISLLANIENPFEVKTALSQSAEGVGLYRTEFIYVDHNHPDEETHYNAYASAARKLGNRSIVVRTLDLGADKDFGLFRTVEDNPFLGCRSLRLCFKHENVFRTQLRAILRASVHGNVAIMFPMVSSVEDIKKALDILSQVKEELHSQNIHFAPRIPIGIMIEIPSAAITCDLFVDYVDFFCIGTNDLVQYTLAVDRCNENVANYYKFAHPAIFRLIQHVIQVGNKHGVRVSICGEISKEMIIVLIGMGLKEFSLSPYSILEVKKMIRAITLQQTQKIAKRVLGLVHHDDVIRYLRKKIKNIEKEYD